MKAWTSRYSTTDIQDGVVHRVGERSFSRHEYTTRHQNSYPSQGCKNQNVIQNLGKKNWCLAAHMKN